MTDCALLNELFEIGLIGLWGFFILSLIVIAYVRIRDVAYIRHMDRDMDFDTNGNSVHAQENGSYGTIPSRYP